jgi:NAD(P)-dependent dehydrogenase (short-subunit alcohol dehydrogenase family)
MKKLDNKVAIITGGAGGIGKATALEFLNEGSDVLLFDLNESDLKKTMPRNWFKSSKLFCGRCYFL